MQLKDYIDLSAIKSKINQQINVIGIDNSIKINDVVENIINIVLKLDTKTIQDLNTSGINLTKYLIDMLNLEIINTLESNAFILSDNITKIDMSKFKVLSRASKYLDNILLQLPLGAYVICNGAIGAFLMDSKYFKISPENIKMVKTIYHIGNIHSVKIYINPLMNWKDKRLITVNENFWNYKINDLILEKNTNSLNLSILQEINDVKHTTYDLVSKDLF